MASNEPFDQLTGVLKVYLAPVGEIVPAVNAAPAGGWVWLGETDGGQKLTHGGALTFLRDDNHQGPVKAIRPEESVMVEFTLVKMTLENYAPLLNQVNSVAT